MRSVGCAGTALSADGLKGGWGIIDKRALASKHNLSGFKVHFVPLAKRKADCFQGTGSGKIFHWPPE